MDCISKRLIMRHYKSVAEYVEDSLAREQSLQLLLNGKEVGRTMSTPGRDEQLVCGFLYTEGLIRDAAHVRDIRFTSTKRGHVVAHVRLLSSVMEEPASASRPGAAPANISAEQIIEYMQGMEAAQKVFRRTGATHCSALYDERGRLLAFAEDIGRHNALDKVIGQALQQGTLDQAVAAAMSSRLSYELVNKAVAAGLSYLCGVSVATCLAVDVAEEHGLTLVGRVRGPRMNVYTHKYRVLPPRISSEDDVAACSTAS